MNNLIKRSLLNVVGLIAYISIVATIMQYGSKIFGQKDTFITPILVLMLFVFSASVSGSLILGKPILLYWDGKKQEAIKMFLYSLGWLAVAIVIAVVIMILMNQG